MSKGRINWPVIIVAILAIAVVAGSAIGLRAWNRSNRMIQGKTQGLKAWDEQRWNDAASFLGRYLEVKQGLDVDDPEYPVYQDILYKYAQAQLKIRPRSRGNLTQAVNAFNILLRADWNKLNDEGKVNYLTSANSLAEIYIRQQPGEAVSVCERVIKAVEDTDFEKLSIDRKDKDIFWELHQKHLIALTLQRKYPQAGEEALAILAKKPDLIIAYEIMAQVVDKEPEKFEGSSIDWLNKAVQNNPELSQAWLVRAAYYNNLAGKNRRNQELVAKYIGQALSDTLKAVALQPGEINLKIQAALLLNQLDKPDDPQRSGLRQQAQGILNEVQQEDPLSLALWNARLVMASTGGSDQQVAEVVDQALATLTWQKWDLYPQAIEIYIQADELDKADSLIKEIRDSKMMESDVAFWQGWVAMRRNEVQTARESFERAYGLGQKDIRIRLFMAQLYAQIGDLLTAEYHLRALVAENTKSAALRLALARLLMQRGNYLDAEVHAQEAARLDPANGEAAVLVIQARLRNIESQNRDPDPVSWRNLKASVQNMAQGVPESTSIKLLQFRVALQEKQYDQARQILQQAALAAQAAQSESDSLAVKIAEVELMIEQHQDEQAIARLNEFISEYPDNTSLVTVLVQSYLKNKRYAECELVLREALTRFEKPIQKRELALQLADIYDLSEQNDKARELLQTMDTQLKEDIPLKRRRLNYLDLDIAQIIERRNGILSNDKKARTPELDDQEQQLRQQAQVIIDQIKAIEGETSGWQWRLEQARLWMLGDTFAAKQFDIDNLLNENVKNNNSDQDSRLLLAKSAERAGKLRLALSLYQEAYSRAPGSIPLQIEMARMNLAVGDQGAAEEFIDMLKKRDQSAAEGLGLSDEQRAIVMRLEMFLLSQKGDLDAVENILTQFIKENPGEISNRLTMINLKIRNGEYDQAETMLQAIRQENPDSYEAAVMEIQLANVRGQQQQGDAERKQARQQVLALSDQLVNQFGGDRAGPYLIRSQAYVLNDNLVSARADLDKAGQLEPENPEVWNRISLFDEIEGKTANAIAACQKALDLSPNNAELARRLVALHLTSGDPDLRIKGRNELLPAFLEKFPDHTGLKFIQVGLLLQDDNPSMVMDAERILEKMVAEQPLNRLAWSMLIDRAMAAGQSYKAADEKDPADMQFRKAVDLANKALGYLPDNAALMVQKAAAQEQITGITDAEVTLKQLQELYSSNLQIADRLASLYMRQNKIDQAIEIYNNMLAHANSDDEKMTISAGLAVATFMKGEEQAAWDQLQAMRKQAPDSVIPVIAMSRLYARQKQWDQIAALADAWHAAHPDDLDALRRITTELVTSRDKHPRDLAIKYLNLIVAKDPRDQQSALYLAIFQQSSGESSQAAKNYQNILAQQPDNYTAMNNYAWILCEEFKQYDQALEIANRGLALAPNYLDLVDTRGMIQFRMGKFQGAQVDFKRCVDEYAKSAPGRVGSMFHLGRTLIKLNLVEEGKHWLREAEVASQAFKNSPIPPLTDNDLEEIRQLLAQ